MQTDSGDTVRVPTEDVAEVPTGAMVEATVGEPVEDQAAADGYAPALEVLSAEVIAEPVPDQQTTAETIAPVNHPVTVVMLQPAGAARDSTSLAQVVAAVNGPVGDFWEQQSGGVVRVGVTATVDWFQGTTTCADPYALWTEAAAKAGWTYAAGRHLLVYVPAGAPGCSYGLGEVRQDMNSGGRSYVQGTITSLIAHELGHNFGLGHSSKLQCSAALEGAGSACEIASYHDYYDVMGISWDEVGSLSASHAAQLGALPNEARTTITASSASGTYTLSPMSGGVGTRVVQLVTAAGTAYWVEYRAPTGQDAWLGDGARNRVGLQSGVVIRRGNPGSQDSSLLLDPTPASSTYWNGDVRTALPIGTVVPLAGGVFSVTVSRVDPAGAVVAVSVGSHPIDVKYAATGGPAGVLGAATSVRRCGLPADGCAQDFSGGSIYWSAAAGARVVAGELGSSWKDLGGPSSSVGYPVTDTLCGLRDGGCYQLFERGSMYDSASTAPQVVRGAVRDRWVAAKLENGVLGYPTGAETCGLAGGGCLQTFTGGVIGWSPATGARVLLGEMGQAWRTGNGAAVVGHPITDTLCGLRDGGCYQLFERGSMYDSASTAPQVVRGAVRDRWVAAKLENGVLGYPTGAETCGLAAGGCLQTFTGGVIGWSPATGARVLLGEMGQVWRTGNGAAVVGHPITDTLCGLRDGGCYQLFERGSMYDSASTAPQVVRGAVRDRWVAAKLENGVLGYPTGAETCGLAGGGCLQTFTGGVIGWSPVTGAQSMTGAIAGEWLSASPQFSGIGYPVEAARTGAGSVTQEFQSATLVEDLTSGTVISR
ncbi:hypothetical protein [Modestobacter sp. VKM Ac-2984]|uniref:hypothetical protein n=1 Tax=Modestobacter sp. VKM Ac-2984 TaxID=3004138 RepID=UPI0022AA21C0|nr:hypothetical protein [Modestobacter sp. VKM Ac-2984]MCZ2817076.1 hypothetical protein [Modestobacter sp. VKM Ac-2984]